LKVGDGESAGSQLRFVINNITLSEGNARQLFEQLQPVSRRAAASAGDIRAGIGEDYATLNVIKMFAGTGKF
jgi:hypothetical protein